MKSKYALKNKQYFNKVINKGYKVRSKYFLLSFVNADDFQLGISIPKKLGNAVFRNKNKRIVKNLIHQLSAFNKKQHIVLIVKQPFVDLTFEEKRNILLQELNKIK